MIIHLEQNFQVINPLITSHKTVLLYHFLLLLFLSLAILALAEVSMIVPATLTLCQALGDYVCPLTKHMLLRCSLLFFLFLGELVYAALREYLALRAELRTTAVPQALGYTLTVTVGNHQFAHA